MYLYSVIDCLLHNELMVDTLASRGDEGRARLRKVSGSRQETFRSLARPSSPLKQYSSYYRGSQFYWWRKLEYTGKTTNFSQVTDKHYHIMLYPDMG